MEDLIVNSKEHKLLKKFQKQLEKRYNVQIRMPNSSSLESDVIFISIQGEKINRDNVKKFLSEKMSVSSKTGGKENVIVITLSDSEEEPSSTQSGDESTQLPSVNTAKFGSTLTFKDSRNDSVCIIDTSKNSEGTPRDSQDDSVCVIGSSRSSESTPQVIKNVINKKRKIRNRKRKKAEDIKVSKKAKLSESVVYVSKESPSRIAPAVDFIPLRKESKSVNKRNGSNNNSCHKSATSNEINNDDIIVIDESPRARQKLRPIVIDGSNVAREHGRASNSFSVKGIKLAIDYFLNRGHKDVTAFVPKFRRNPNPNRQVPTTDAEILDELEKKQLVTYTPSRWVNGKLLASYDDRFIVQLAAKNKGVIVSNDNYRDLINESESYKEAIEKRLLMFCFAGDEFMVPDDPLGRNGPSLNDYLSFSPDS